MLNLSEEDAAKLDGANGDAAALAMRIVVRAAEIMEAPHLIDIEAAHIDGCLYHGATSLDFVERLVDGGGRVAVPTTLNVGSMDLIHPELFRGSEAIRSSARRLMEAHLELGCEPTFTCAPYQLSKRPQPGQQIAWAESNAIVFANSVLGARTNRYGDFIDLCAAITGRAPYAGLHVAENRFGQSVFHVRGLDPDRVDRDVLFAALGFLVGRESGVLIPVLTGLPRDTTEDELKALGAAAASSGSVSLFHAVGVTPEAATIDIALGDRSPIRTVDVSMADLQRVRSALNHGRKGDALVAVSVGTPHFSLAEFRELDRLVGTRAAPFAIDFYVNTSRSILAELERTGIASRLAEAGVQIVADTCTYVTTVMRRTRGLVMTNSGKWAHYAPANIGVEVAFGSLSECVRSAALGTVWFDDLDR